MKHNFSRKVVVLCIVLSGKHGIAMYEKYFEIGNIYLRLLYPYKINGYKFGDYYCREVALGNVNGNVYCVNNVIHNKPSLAGLKLYMQDKQFSIYENYNFYITIDDNFYGLIDKHFLIVTKIYDSIDTLRRSIAGPANCCNTPYDDIIILHGLANNSSIMIHSSSIYRNNDAILFIGYSGIGKSTIMNMFLSDNHAYDYLNEDQNIISYQQNEGIVYSGYKYERMQRQKKLKAIFVLNQAPDNNIQLIPKEQALVEIIKYIHKPTPFDNIDWWENILYVIENIVNSTPIYKCNFNKDGKIVNIIEHECALIY